MGAILSLPLTLLNALLPFTNPKTPLIQDLIHTAILCGTLYYAPQLAEHFHAAHPHQPSPPIENALPDPTAEDTFYDGANGVAESQEDLPLEENLILQPESDAEDETAEPPPHAPTPPPTHHQQAARAPPPPFDHNQQHHFPLDNDFAEPGPANPAQGPRPTPVNRTIGTKKAKSLARKDQRRAYHEFHRQEAELRRLRDAEGAEEREEALQAEKARRAEAERGIAEREKQAREKKKEEERKGQEEEQQRRDRVIVKVREEVEAKGAVDLVDLAWAEGKDKVWIERLVRASGLLAQLSREGAHAVITGSGWVVRIDNKLMQQAYAEAVGFGNRNGGKVGFEEFGNILEKAVRAKVKA